MNVVDQKEIDKYRDDKFDEIEADIREEFDRYGNLKSFISVRPKIRKIGAEVGSVFIEFERLLEAEFCMKNMKGRRYMGREIKCVFIDEQVYLNDLQFKKETK
jgi:hypothetical protein